MSAIKRLTSMFFPYRCGLSLLLRPGVCRPALPSLQPSPAKPYHACLQQHLAFVQPHSSQALFASREILLPCTEAPVSPLWNLQIPCVRYRECGVSRVWAVPILCKPKETACGPSALSVPTCRCNVYCMGPLQMSSVIIIRLDLRFNWLHRSTTSNPSSSHLSRNLASSVLRPLPAEPFSLNGLRTS